MYIVNVFVQFIVTDLFLKGQFRTVALGTFNDEDMGSIHEYFPILPMTATCEPFTW